MDIRDFLYKIDSIQNKEQLKEDVKKTHIKEASQVMLYGDTPEDMAAIAQIFKNAGITPPPAIVQGPTPEESVSEEIPGKANTTPEPEYKDTKYMTKDISGGINKIKKQYRKEYPGDNPMAVEKTEEEIQSSIKEALKQAYEAKKSKSPYAIGMAQAMKSTGDQPPLKKSTITKAHDIAKAIKTNK
jgi:hypothetical protein